ncbi:MAG: zinc-dependent alcohol dehydrogenase family protein [Alphaproteobacteria bacterium]|nr:zinc-dependent alcohol dehydrogenase family protein [Alphaproteobacteria bacterium]
MRIRAAVLHVQGAPRPYAQSRPMTIEEVELDPPGPHEVLIRVGAAGLCHSDLSTIENLRPRPLPIVIGHEGAGVVEAVGEGVSDLARGDHVVCLFVSACGHCRPCVRGKPNICEGGFSSRAVGTLPSGQRRLRWQGRELNHGSGLALFAEYTVVDRTALVKIERDIPLQDAALFGCAVMTGAGAVLNTAALKAGDEIAIIGLGGVGMCALMAAVTGGAARIVVVDTQASKLALARQWGATDTFDATDPDCVGRIREATRGGLDTVVETAGALSALNLAYAITARGGQVVTAGLPHIQATFQFTPNALVSDEKSIRGSYMGSCVPPRDIPRFLALYRQGKLPVERLRQGVVGLDGLNAGFDRLAEGEVLRQMLVP